MPLPALYTLATFLPWLLLLLPFLLFQRCFKLLWDRVTFVSWMPLIQASVSISRAGRTNKNSEGYFVFVCPPCVVRPLFALLLVSFYLPPNRLSASGSKLTILDEQGNFSLVPFTTNATVSYKFVRKHVLNYRIDKLNCKIAADLLQTNCKLATNLEVNTFWIAELINFPVAELINFSFFSSPEKLKNETLDVYVAYFNTFTHFVKRCPRNGAVSRQVVWDTKNTPLRCGNEPLTNARRRFVSSCFLSHQTHPARWIQLRKNLLGQETFESLILKKLLPNTVSLWEVVVPTAKLSILLPCKISCPCGLHRRLFRSCWNFFVNQFD